VAADTAADEETKQKGSVVSSYLAHVKWFVEKEPNAVLPLSMDEWLVVVCGVLLGTVLLYGVHRLLIRWGITKQLDTSLGRFGKLVPYIVRYTTGLLLVINAAKGLLFAPNVPTSVHQLAPTLSLIMAVCGVLFIIGFKVRTAAAVLLATYVFALLAIDPTIDILDHVEYLGIGLYLLLNGYKPYLGWADKMRWSKFVSPEALLRIFVGVGLMVLAVTEKLVGIDLSTNFLAHHDWNFLAGLGVDDRVFIIISGIVEFLVGFTLVLNIAPRLTTAIVAVLMTITALLLGVEEVFGHLFALSLVAVVWLRPELPAKNRSRK